MRAPTPPTRSVSGRVEAHEIGALDATSRAGVVPHPRVEDFQRASALVRRLVKAVHRHGALRGEVVQASRSRAATRPRSDTALSSACACDKACALFVLMTCASQQPSSTSSRCDISIDPASRATPSTLCACRRERHPSFFSLAKPRKETERSSHLIEHNNGTFGRQAHAIPN